MLVLSSTGGVYHPSTIPYGMRLGAASLVFSRVRVLTWMRNPLKRDYGRGHLHFVTFSRYPRFVSNSPPLPGYRAPVSSRDEKQRARRTAKCKKSARFSHSAPIKKGFLLESQKPSQFTRIGSGGLPPSELRHPERSEGTHPQRLATRPKYLGSANARVYPGRASSWVAVVGTVFRGGPRGAAPFASKGAGLDSTQPQ